MFNALFTQSTPAPLNAITPLNLPNSLAKPNSKILLQRADRLGDMVFCLPVISLLKKAYPTVEIHMICSPQNEFLVSPHPLISKHYSISISTASHKEKKDLLTHLKSQNYVLYLSFWAHPFFEKLGKKAGIPYRIGPSTSPLSRFYFSHPITQQWQNLNHHETSFNLNLLSPLSIPTFPTPYNLYPDAFFTQENTFFKHLKSLNKCILFIFTETGGSNTPIPIQTIQALIHTFSKQPHFHIVLSGTSKTNPLRTFTHPCVTNAICKTQFTDLIAILSLSSFYIGPDTGPAHLAAFMNIPSIVVFRDRYNLPTRWGSVADRFAIVRYEHMSSEYLRNQHEYAAILRAFNSLSSDSPALSPAERHLYRLKQSLRLLWLFPTKMHYAKHKAYLQKQRQAGWVIYCHIQRPGCLRNIICILSKLKRFNINTTLSSTFSILPYYLKFRFHTKALYTPIHLTPQPPFPSNFSAWVNKLVKNI